ncbi:MAG: DUF2237 domain-containing protein [Candidatus Omnitrophica bacterium]|nr:DUF2237 domain-containing protein [Candidatus Omnitrophota bacterium]
MLKAKNVLGEDLQPCCKFPMTGFYRDGSCNTGPEDVGRHVVCIKVTEAFLKFSKEAGNDLSTPYLDHDFPGLIDGDQWCLCALRWQEAFEAGAAPLVVLASTHVSALEVLKLEDLKTHAASVDPF